MQSTIPLAPSVTDSALPLCEVLVPAPLEVHVSELNFHPAGTGVSSKLYAPGWTAGYDFVSAPAAPLTVRLKPATEASAPEPV